MVPKRFPSSWRWKSSFAVFLIGRGLNNRKIIFNVLRAGYSKRKDGTSSTPTTLKPGKQLFHMSRRSPILVCHLSTYTLEYLLEVS
jgi:hypothetical protein